jgi:hypothetical protein
MPDGMDWLMRPCHEGLCRYREIIDGTYDICDIADMNDSLDVKAENAYRARAAMKK